MLLLASRPLTSDGRWASSKRAMDSPSQAVTLPALLAELETALSTGPSEPVVAFDADGTLWRGDLGETLFEALLRVDGVREAAREALGREAKDFDIAVSDESANGIARTLLRAFEQGQYPEDRAFAMMAWVFAGWSADELTTFTARVVDAFGFADAVRHDVLSVIAWAKQRKLPVWVVSASPLCAIQEAAKRLVLEPQRLLAMAPQFLDGAMLPRLGSPATYGEGKVKRLRAAIGDQPILAAFGDSAWDAVMLRASQVPVAVYPAASLRELLPSIPGVRQLGEE